MYEAVANMKNVAETENKVPEQELKGRIAGFITAILMIVPFVGEAAGALGGTTMRSLILLAGKLGKVAAQVTWNVALASINPKLGWYCSDSQATTSVGQSIVTATLPPLQSLAHEQSLGCLHLDVSLIDPSEPREFNQLQATQHNVGFAPTSGDATITHQAARDLMSRHSSWKRWPCIPSEVKVETHKWINRELEKQGVPGVREDILDWRMSRALPDAARAAMNKTRADASSQDNDPFVNVGDASKSD
ncbi:hypothetical protein OPT61_g4447 [Boeremia exigua]|uniref:Uncharacterized protein n=1 Tax=Boeremia exigua TaxID=749465 RepID=A0ACC2IE27_9PLEO|nr:hypothetical protein OPT61_g4447 [Boeremia exigua]